MVELAQDVALQFQPLAAKRLLGQPLDRVLAGAHFWAPVVTDLVPVVPVVVVVLPPSTFPAMTPEPTRMATRMVCTSVPGRMFSMASTLTAAMAARAMVTWSTTVCQVMAGSYVR